MLDKFLIEDIIKNALREDMNGGDITSDYLIDKLSIGKGIITSKEEGIICGLDIAELVFSTLDSTLTFTKLKKDGDMVTKGENIATIEGSLSSILKGERVALNFLQRMSGIASKSRIFADRVKEYKVRVVDTRKTTPGLRVFEKYSVKIGGCFNHRHNLSDAVMIKDNHIIAAGGIKQAVEKLRKNIPHTTKIEVEVKNLGELQVALDLNTDIIMLDNMSIENMKKAVDITKGKAILEASGNVTEENIIEIAKTGVDIISVGALTHSVKSLDISLNILNL